MCAGAVTEGIVGAASTGGTLLHLASSLGHPSVVRRLLTLGASPNLMRDGATPLHLASNDRVAELLLASGANANVVGREGETPLHLASRRGDEKTVDMLLRQGGARINVRDSMGRTPLSEGVRCAPMADGEERRRYKENKKWRGGHYIHVIASMLFML